MGSEALERAMNALPDMRGLLDADDRRECARDVILAFLEDDSTLERTVLAAMGFVSNNGEFSAPAHMQARDAIRALRSLALPHRSQR